MDKGWEYASRLPINDSYDIFQEIKPAEVPAQRLADLGKAATLINVQPKTDGNIREADDILQELIKKDGSDEVSITSRYLLARIAQIHLTPPDENLAIQRYTSLIDAFPDHPLSQAARTKRALLRIFALNEETTLESRYQDAVKDVPLMKEPGPRRDYLLLLANMSARLQKPPAETLGQLLQAETCNNFRKRALGDLYVSIAEFALAAGKKDVALAYYDKFLGGFPRDNRRFLVQEKRTTLTTKEITR